MDDLIAFLRARLDEDEQIARSAEPSFYWRHSAPTVDAASHAARHDPARVLREVDAKRRMLELHGLVHRDIGWLENGDEEGAELPVCGLCVPKNSHYQRRADVPEGPCLTVRAITIPYADHPDYRPEWTP